MQYMKYNNNCLAGPRPIVHLILVVDWSGKGVLHLEIASILEELRSALWVHCALTLSTSIGGKSSNISFASDPSSSSSVLSSGK